MGGGGSADEYPAAKKIWSEPQPVYWRQLKNRSTLFLVEKQQSELKVKIGGDDKLRKKYIEGKGKHFSRICWRRIDGNLARWRDIPPAASPSALLYVTCALWHYRRNRYRDGRKPTSKL